MGESEGDGECGSVSPEGLRLAEREESRCNLKPTRCTCIALFCAVPVQTIVTARVSGESKPVPSRVRPTARLLSHLEHPVLPICRGVSSTAKVGTPPEMRL